MSSDPISRLSVADAGEIYTLQLAAYVSQGHLHDDYRIPPLVQTFEELVEELKDPDVIALGIRQDGRLVASVRLHVQGATAELGRFTVVPDLVGQGWGTRLEGAVDDALPAGVERIELFTGDRSVDNLRLYARLGYAEDRRESVGTYDLVFLSRPRD